MVIFIGLIAKQIPDVLKMLFNYINLLEKLPLGKLVFGQSHGLLMVERSRTTNLRRPSCS